ncbi:UNVERIFIED_CONTAM: hypothetical protein GTU68_045725 [Idotea baltica]|nr:hypothetical protein [Idotea baltica]
MKNYKAKNRLLVPEYIRGILSSDRVILSRAITLIESNLDSDKKLAKEIIQSILPNSGKSFRIGITGVPGVGKSTFIEAFGKLLISKGHKVAILSIDPSSQRTKGSILGDKTRMEELVNMENAYIRPSATEDTLGGVANKTTEAMLLCEAAGYDIILIETVGVGQSETAVHNMTDFFLLLMLAGAGDELQGIKKGIMEMADLLIINKADGNNIEKSQLAKQQYENAMHLFPETESGWTPLVSTISAINKEGIDWVWNEILNYKNLVFENGHFIKNRNRQKIEWMHSSINDSLKDLFYGSEHISDELKKLKKQVIAAEISPTLAAEEIIRKFKNSF